MRVALREYKPDCDDSYIYQTWSKNCFYSPQEPITVSKKVWFQAKIKYIESMLKNAKTYVACLESDPTVIIGYSVMKDDELEWIYIKSAYRGQGVEHLLTNVPKGKIHEE